ncbi:hypothetical protein OIDMADRAFT_20781 [Oidiodendron maius Zn]|uniref:Uncharacterized protein n=1 Tax=Oidiodendron maius (strain Zn) TaxID=913774 RepID=A0A0C3CBT3_OIDMZ|nr:hypothetical protein OIDMADRAFT_20781 [Oidiodendron maius Zn]
MLNLPPTLSPTQPYLPPDQRHTELNHPIPNIIREEFTSHGMRQPNHQHFYSQNRTTFPDSLANPALWECVLGRGGREGYK